MRLFVFKFMIRIQRSLHILPGPAFVVVLFLVVASYINTLYSPLVLDDIQSFVEEPNVYLKTISFEEIASVVQNRFGMARFVPMLSFALNHYFGNGSVVYFHLTNIAIHLLAVWALYVFLNALLRTEIGRNSLGFLKESGRYALFVCALWALNPLQTNAVTYLVQRMTSLAALFYLLSLACYLHGRLANGTRQRVMFFLAAMLAAVLAFLSKENSATLPLAILLAECVFISPGLAGRVLNRLRWYHWSLLVLIILVLLPLGQQPWQVMTAGYDMREFTLAERLLTQLRVVVFYITLLALPLPGRLNLDHDFTISTGLLSPPSTLLAGLFLLFLLSVAILLRKRSPLISLGIFWFFLNLVVESSVIPLELVFEHRLYLPSVGFFMALVAALDWLAFRLSPQRSPDGQKIYFLLMVILAAASSLLTTLRNEDWRDSLSLYEDCYNKAPNKARTSTNLGMVLSQAGRTEESRVALERAMGLAKLNDETVITTANNLLHGYVMEGKYDEAIARGDEYFSKITRDKNFSGFDKFMRNWGYAYQMTGHYAEALDTYVTGLLQTNNSLFLVKAIEHLFVEASKSEQGRHELGLSGEQIDVSLQMVNVLLRLRHYDLAGKYLDQARQLDAGHTLVERYEKRLADELERNKIAREQYDIANDETYRNNNWFRIYMALARFVRSYYQPLQGRPLLWLITQARAIAPDDPFVILWLAHWEIEHDRYQEAGQLLIDASASQPDFVPFLEELGRFYLSFGKPELAAGIYKRLLELYPGHPKWAGCEEVIRGEEQKEKGAPLAGENQTDTR
ncbi:MAG: hypothetical protein A2521_13215 [Deltaproteobacteria bacterium RIFOXYD12_FULL_57_12]|nr:MAG: hypothetical protein A2521_13215 [Deltaproteobacteria bacterium RIFOXYD12_FULL_57_12]